MSRCEKTIFEVVWDGASSKGERRMGVRFRRSIKICKGAKVNIGKTGASLTLGTKGFHHTIHTSGKKTTSAGIPGTGLSYVSTSGNGKRYFSGNRSTIGVQRQAYIQQQKDMEYDQNREMVDDFNELIDKIQSIHDECSEPVDWIALREKPAPFDIMNMGPYETQARKELNDVKPSFLGHFVPAADKKRMQVLEDAIQNGKAKDQQMYTDWKDMKNLATRVLNGDIDSYFYVVSEMSPFDEILDFGSDFDIGTDNPEFMEVEFHAKTAKVVPNHVLSMTSTGKLSSKVMTKTMHYDIVQDYICSCALRIAREMFALLPIEKVVIHAIDTIQDRAGNEYDDTVLSVLILRNELVGIDFDTIDASDTIKTFECNMNFKKTQGFKPVKRIECVN